MTGLSWIYPTNIREEQNTSQDAKGNENQMDNVSQTEKKRGKGSLEAQASKRHNYEIPNQAERFADLRERIENSVLNTTAAIASARRAM